MNKLIESGVNVYQAQLQAAKDLGELLLSGIEQIDRMALQAGKDALAEQLKNAQTLAAPRDFFGAAAAWRETVAQANLERATVLPREILATLTNTVVGMSSVCKAYMEELERNAGDVMANMQQRAAEASGAGASGQATDIWNATWQRTWQQMHAMSEQYIHAVQAAAGDAKANANAAPVLPSKTGPATGTRSGAHAM
jgi:hypothetical protein